ncbi:MAG: ribosomal protein S18-alanine N-acetyltransferase [Deltaproteobacteria bacterium]|nr:ribosomal protein S18-alanine N-acetyltransferase [Deltaproteobacteria bacterium]
MIARRARADEAAALAALAALAHVEGWSTEALAKAATEPAWGLWVLPDAVGPRGFALVQVVADEAELLLIAVRPEARRSGAGRALFEAARRQAVAEGAEAMFLEVAANNHAALAFYAALGFSEVGRRRRYYADGQDAVAMRADLGSGKGPLPPSEAAP